MKKLIAIDIDGTLAHDDGEISNFSKIVIEKLTKASHTVVLCTARPRYHAIKLSLDLGLRYFICLSGAEVYDLKYERIISDVLMDKDDVESIYNYASAHNIRMIFSSDREYATQFTRNENQVLVDNIDDLKHSIKECLIMDDKKEAVAAFRDEMLGLGLNIVTHSNAGDSAYFIVLSKDSNKGEGLMKLAQFLDFDKADIISFGNDNNDISMIKASSALLAVGNSTEELKQIATLVIDSNNNDGVAKYLEELLINEA